MYEIINNIIENSKLAYKKSILLDNEELEDLLFSIMTDATKLLDKTNKDENTNNSITQNRTEDEEIKRVKKKIPSWFSKPNQYNHKILVAYMKLSNNNTKMVNIEDLEKESNIGNSQKFLSNFNQMKIISYKNHGKVFSEENGIITLWSSVADYIVEEFEKLEGKTNGF